MISVAGYLGSFRIHACCIPHVDLPFSPSKPSASLTSDYPRFNSPLKNVRSIGKFRFLTPIETPLRG